MNNIITSWSKKTLTFIRSPISLFIIILVLFFSFGSPYFLSVNNFYNILLKATTVGLLALALGFVIINGNIDLSVGSLLGLTSAVFVIVYNQTNLGIAIIVTLSTGMAVGLWNGLCVWGLKINSFIVTLASMIGVKGLTFTITNENSITLDAFDFTNLSVANFLSIPIIGWLYILIACLLALTQNWTIHGRSALYVGGNKRAARAAGINTGFHELINFVICGFIVAVTGILLTAQLGAATPNTGRGYELWAITAVALGGVRLVGGVGKISLVFLGGLTIAILRNGMNLMHLGTAYIYVVTGIVLLLVMAVDRYVDQIHAWFDSVGGQGAKLLKQKQSQGEK